MSKKQKYHYFVAHEFSKQKRDDLRRAIEEAFRGSALRAYYADVEVRQKHILDKIEERILRAQFGIYDVTDSNPNVCLELGIARGAKRSYYIIHENHSRLPADLDGLDRIDYESYKQLTEELKKKVVGKEIERSVEIRESLKQEHYEKTPEQEVVQKCSKLYQAERFLHRFGNEVEDEDASNKKAWCANLFELRGHIIYGPYEALPEPGDYMAFFRMKIDDNSSVDPMLLLDVTGGGFASKVIRGANFLQPTKYQLFGLRFSCRTTEPMEYRVLNQLERNEKLWIDYVAVVKSSALTR